MFSAQTSPAYPRTLNVWTSPGAPHQDTRHGTPLELRGGVHICALLVAGEGGGSWPRSLSLPGPPGALESPSVCVSGTDGSGLPVWDSFLHLSLEDRALLLNV